VRM
jgi:hypothetical protein